MSPVDYSGKEKRITFQLYNYWFGLAGDGGIPSLKLLSPEDIAPYKNNMVLIDFRDPDSEPTLQVIGQLLQQDMDRDLTLAGISEIPRRSLLSRITDHYMEVLANKSPISFDAEFINKAREKILYRGILLPFSDDGENINFILGAIRWINGDEIPGPEEPEKPEPEKPEPEKNKPEETRPETMEKHQLQQHLDICRALVQGQSPADARSRKSLYEALGAVLDFHELCCSNPESYRELIRDEGIKAQKRAPFTPTLKLCFGHNYDKTRLTEYAAALSHARKNGQSGADLPDFLDHFPGGIKGCVRAEREGREGYSPSADKNISRQIIGELPAIASFPLSEDIMSEDIETGGDLCLLLGHRKESAMEIIRILTEEEKMLEQILKRVAQNLKKTE